jgi:acetoin utilization deacetylase AcuC-like enzyme
VRPCRLSSRANIRVTHEGIHGIVRGIMTSADVPMVFVLEGGYDLPSLCDPMKITIEEMMRLLVRSGPMFRREGIEQ